MSESAEANPTSSSRHGSGAAILIGLAPFIVMWILMGVVDFQLAVVLAFVTSLLGPVSALIRRRPQFLLDLGAAVWFLLVLILAFSADETFLQEWLQPIVNAGLLIISLASLALRKPWILQYARLEASPEFQRNEVFTRICWNLTWMWTVVFAVMTVSALIPPLVQGTQSWNDKTDTLSVICYWVIPIGALIVGIFLNTHYPQWQVEKARRSTGADEDVH